MLHAADERNDLFHLLTDKAGPQQEMQDTLGSNHFSGKQKQQRNDLPTMLVVSLRSEVPRG